MATKNMVVEGMESKFAYKLTIQHPISKEEMFFMAVPEKEKSWKILEDIVIE